MYDICCVGHITADKVINKDGIIFMPGGTAWYIAYGLCRLDVNFLLVTALGEAEMHYAAELYNKGVSIQLLPSGKTVIFENTYAENQDHRTQRVLAKAAAFDPDQLMSMDARIFHLGPLLADDIPLTLVSQLSRKGIVSLDAQGYLRLVKDEQVYAVDWPEKLNALKYVTILKVDEGEMQVLTGFNDVEKGARQLADWGAREVVITNGSMGSVIYSNDIFYEIQAYSPKILIDATGCGDTYMAGYLYKRVKGAGIREAGEFAAAMASLKMESPGPFKGTEKDVCTRMNQR